MATLTSPSLFREVITLMELHAVRKHDDAKIVADRIFEFFESTPADHLKGIYFFAMGMRFHVQSRFTEALANFEKGFRHARDKGDMAAINHLASGFSNKSLGNLDEAVNHLFLAREKLNPQGPLKGFFFYCYVHLGEIHAAIDEHQSALDFFNKGLEASGNPSNLPVLYNAIGNCYYSMGKFQQAEKYHLKAMDERNISPILLSKIQNDLAVLYLHINEFGKAEALLETSIALRQKNNLEDAAGTGMCYLAEAYLKQNKIYEAIALLEQCRVISEKYRTKSKEVKILHLLAKAYTLNEDYRTAIQYYEKYHKLQIEIKGEQEKNILKLKNDQIEKQRKTIEEKHQQLMITFEEIKKLKINRKAVFFSWITVIVLVLVSEIFLDPVIENNSYNTLISMLVKVGIALLFKPLDGLYEKILWERAIRRVT